MRICCLVPFATEMLFALGLGEDVAAVSHACDHPPAALAKPKATTTSIDPALMSSSEIDQLVADALSTGKPTYHIDMDVLAAARPELIVTQDVCGVCAVDGGEVRRAAALLNPAPQVVSLEPSSLADIPRCLRALGHATGAADAALALAAQMNDRISAVRNTTAGVARRRVLCLEWLDPPWIAGHWMPEVVEVAGGSDTLGIKGWPSRRATWAEIARAAPELVILMPCGLSVERTLAELHVLASVPEVQKLPAFIHHQVYAIDGTAYFSRPGPRIVDGIELLGSILHPDLFAQAWPPGMVHRVERLAL